MTTTALTSLSQRINNLSESQTIAMSKKARELASSGINVVNLTLGEPDFDTPEHIKAGAKKAIDEGFTSYTPVAGIPELKKAIAEKLQNDNKLPWEADNIVVSTGAKQAIANVMLSLINPGDEVIIFTPYWVTYAEIVKLAEGKPVALPGSLENNFKPAAEDLQNAITPNTKLIMFSSPCNPTGSAFTQEELEAYARVIKENEQVYVMADEIYEYINFDEPHFSIGSVKSIQDRVITINGFSKGFAMTGWRVGYMAAPKWLASACEKLQGQITSGTCSIAQKAALTAYTEDIAPAKAMRDAFLHRRDMMIPLLKEIPGFKVNKPAGAFYFFPDISDYFGKSDGETTIHNSVDFSLYLLKHGHVSTVPGLAFGYDNCIRISFAASEDELKEAVKRIKSTVQNLK